MIVVIAVIARFALPSNKENVKEEIVVAKVDPMKKALEYYNAQDYEKAEELFLQVIEEDSGNADAYQYLYEIYDITGQEDKKSEILTLAKSNLNEKDYQTLEINSMKTKYTILDRSVPDFENIPIENYNQNGYIIKINGYYGFIGIDGNYIMDPKYESGMLYNTGSSQETVCFFPDKTQTGVIHGENLDYYLNKISQIECGAGLGGAYVGDYFLDDNHGIYYEAALEKEKRYSNIDILYTRTIENPNEKGKYYIV
ncbi:MAG: tetratricopeptide repeat protein, partial [Floccifex sp.]